MNYFFHGFTISRITYGNNLFVAIGEFKDSSSSKVYSFVSNNGNNWQKYETTMIMGYNLKFLNNQFIFWSNTSENYVFYVSNDGITWTTIDPDHSGFSDLSWDGSQYIGVGIRDEPFTSPDLVTWTAHGNLEAYQDTTISIDKISHNDTFTRWAGIGRGFVSPQLGIFALSQLHPVYSFSSRDGISWIERKQNVQYDFYGISWLNNQFIAHGPEGVLLTSADGVDWIDHSIFWGPSLTDLTFGNGEYLLLVSRDSCCEIWSSSDLESWTIHSYMPTEDIFKNKGAALTSIAFNGTDKFVIVGGRTETDRRTSIETRTGIILTSP